MQRFCLEPRVCAPRSPSCESTRAVTVSQKDEPTVAVTTNIFVLVPSIGVFWIDEIYEISRFVLY